MCFYNSDMSYTVPFMNFWNALILKALVYWYLNR